MINMPIHDLHFFFSFGRWRALSFCLIVGCHMISPSRFVYSDLFDLFRSLLCSYTLLNSSLCCHSTLASLFSFSQFVSSAISFMSAFYQRIIFLMDTPHCMRRLLKFLFLFEKTLMMGVRYKSQKDTATMFTAQQYCPY